MLAATLGCGGTRPPTEAASSPPRAATKEAHPELEAPPTAPAESLPTEDPAPPSEALSREIPTQCAFDGKTCSAPSGFVESTCRSKYPELALALFSKGTPWQRAYVKAETVEPVNVYGGERSERWLYFGEEVLVLRERSPSTARVVVSGPTDVDILRWDGTCATIRKEMLVPYVTAPMTSIRILWKYLDASFQEALARDPLVQRAEAAQRKACRSSSIKNPTESCDKVMQKLTDSIVLAVKNGAELPVPATVPAWRP